MAGSPAALGRRTFFRRPEQQTGAISAHRLFDPHFPALAFRRGTHSVHRHGPDESHGVKRLYCGSAARSSFQRRGRLLRAFRMRYRRHGLPHLQRRVAARRNHIEQKRRTRNASDYVTTIAEQDISRADGVTRNPQYARLILREYARLTASQATQSTILKDLKARDIDLSRDTVNGYLAALRRLYVIQELSAWTPTLRAKSRITKTPTRHFACPSIAAAALGASPESLLLDTATMGLLFESLCVRDLRVYAQANNGEIFHYHDEAEREADAVVQLRDGRYALFEMKLGTSLVDEGAKSLVRLREKIDTNAIGEPVFCAVITPGGFAMRRDDGVFVIPITCLTA